MMRQKIKGLLIILGMVSLPVAAELPKDWFECRPEDAPGAEVNTRNNRTYFNFRNPKCNPPNAKINAMVDAVIQEYGLDNPRDKERFSKGMARYRAELLAARIARSAEEDKKKRESNQKYDEGLRADAQARKARDEAARQEKEAALATRTKQLRSGEIKVASFDDALLYHAPVGSLTGLMLQPFLKPDGGKYGGAIVIDNQERDGSLRVKLNVERGSTTYAFLKLDNKFKAEQLRLNGAVGIVGRYVGNQPYQTIDGQSKTAPILEVLYIGTE